MYTNYFHLKQAPFSIAPDPRYLFMSERHREALAHLLYGIGSGGGFVLLTGEIGAGKTTVCRCFIEQVPDDCRLAYIFNPKLTVEELLQTICDEFRIAVSSAAGVKAYVDAINAYLLDSHAQGHNNVLVIDEAQNLSLQALEEVRLLSNLETDTSKLLQSFLVGQPEFREMLRSPEMEQFRQRVAATCHLGPLDLEDTRHYIEHRLKCAGAAPGKPEFEEAAFEAIFNASHGIPRRINSVCDRLLLLGFLGNKTRLTVDDVDQVVRELTQEVTATTAPAPVRAHAEIGANAGASTALEVDLSRLDLQPGAAESISNLLGDLSAEQQGDRLQRLERSLLRLERISLETLSALQRLVNAIRKTSDEDSR
jgi:general secretion pathway protein A